jgi:nicotinate-nucleotide adenylyltransferase
MDKVINLTNLKYYKNQNIKVGILGGSYDPAHIGHIHIASIAARELGFDEVWFAVAEQNPWKPPHKYSYEERVEKLSKLIVNDKNFKILTIESELKTQYTADLFENLAAHLPNVKFTFIAGSDIAKGIDKWEKFNDLIKLTNIAIFSRGGYSEINKDSDIFKKYNSRIKFFKIEEIQISSTQIRDKENDK